jgi:hypothetical protein
MELVEGETLAVRLKQGRLPMEALRHSDCRRAAGGSCEGNCSSRPEAGQPDGDQVRQGARLRAGQDDTALPRHVGQTGRFRRRVVFDVRA